MLLTACENISITCQLPLPASFPLFSFEYVNLDDGWSEPARQQGKLVANRAAFPSGIKALADYVHSKGLKLGIYGDAGALTCAGYAGSRGFEAVDAQTWAEWGEAWRQRQGGEYSRAGVGGTFWLCCLW